MLRASPRPLRALFLVTGLALLGLACETPHSPSFVASETTAQPAKRTPVTPRALPEGTAEGIPESLLHEYAARDVAPDAEIRTWDLPTKAKRVIVELLILAARDEPARLHTIMTRQARWGAPDRREYDARPVLDGDDGRVFLDTLRATASRFARKQNLTCPPIMPPAAQTYVRNGAEPMWCFYGSNDGLDILAFKLMIEGGSAKLDYVGMHAERPTGMIPRPGPQPPPMTPAVRRAPGSGGPRMPPGMAGAPGPGQPGDPNQPGGVIINPGQPGQPGVIINPGQPGVPGQPGAATPPVQPGQPAAGQPAPGQPGQPAAGQPGQPAKAGQPGQPATGQPGQPAAGQPGQPAKAGQPGQPAAGQPAKAGQPAPATPGQPTPATPATKKPAPPKPAKPTEPTPAPAKPAAPAEATPPAP